MAKQVIAINNSLKAVDTLAEEELQQENKAKNELFEQTNQIEDALEKLEKAVLILDDWDSEYAFYESPNPVAAIEWGRSLPGDKTKHGEQSYTWFVEYNRIIQYISIARDYIHNSKVILDKAIKG